MSQINEETREEFIKKIEKLENENKNLKMKISQLERKNSVLQETIDRLEKKDIEITTEIKKDEPFIVTSTEIQEEIFEKTPKMEQVSEPKEISTAEFEPIITVPKSAKEVIIGVSRRECPTCGNDKHATIQELIDKTHIISNYPKMYGKKYKCGECGQEWRIPIDI